MSIVYLNGEFIAAEKATISPLDRGFVFGDGIYEVIPVFGGQAFRLDEHLIRLENNLDAIRIDNPMTSNQWQTVINDLVEQNGGNDLSIYLQITRGVARRDHKFPTTIVPTIFIMTSPLLPLPDDTRKLGIKAITCEDIRWQYCHIKSIALQANVLMRQQAFEQGAEEAILIKDGFVTEGAASNIFIIANDTLITVPISNQLLPGITRDFIIELALDNGIKVAQENISLEQLYQADEVWLSSSVREIVPVTLIDEQTIGNGKPGSAWAKMDGLYQAYKKQYNRQAA